MALGGITPKQKSALLTTAKNGGLPITGGANKPLKTLRHSLPADRGTLLPFALMLNGQKVSQRETATAEQKTKKPLRRMA